MRELHENAEAKIRVKISKKEWLTLKVVYITLLVLLVISGSLFLYIEKEHTFVNIEVIYPSLGVERYRLFNLGYSASIMSNIYDSIIYSVYGVSFDAEVNDSRMQDMCRFLESLVVDFGDGTACLRESPSIEKDRCYLNTNYLALEVLRLCNSSVVPKLESFLAQYDNVLYDDKNRLRILLFKDIPLPPRSVVRVFLGIKTSITGEIISIYADILSDNVFSDWQYYADQLMLASLQELKNGNYECAWKYRNRAEKMWEDIGFEDKVYHDIGLYETYKLSLYYFLMRALGHRDHIAVWIENNIDKFISNGGVVTHYDNSFTPHGDPNIETTVITVLAFYSDYPSKFLLHTGKPYISPWKPLEKIAIVIASFAMGLILAKIALKAIGRIRGKVK